MPIMLTLRFQRDFSLPMREAHQTRPGYDATNQSCFEIPESTMLPYVCDYCKGCKHSPNLWQEHHHKAKEALRCASKGKREFTSIWDRWQNDETFRKSQLVHEWSDAWVRYLDHIAQIDISHTAPHSQREGYNNLL